MSACTTATSFRRSGDLAVEPDVLDADMLATLIQAGQPTGDPHSKLRQRRVSETGSSSRTRRADDTAQSSVRGSGRAVDRRPDVPHPDARAAREPQPGIAMLRRCAGTRART